METVKIENPNVASLPKHRKGISAALVIVVCLIVAHLFFYYVCGNPSNFDAKGHPIDNNIFGTLYQGGFVIPIVITLLLTVLALGVRTALSPCTRRAEKAKSPTSSSRQRSCSGRAI